MAAPSFFTQCLFHAGLLLFTLATAQGQDKNAAPTHFTLTLDFTGLLQGQGDLYIGLYHKAEGFMDMAQTFRQAVVPVSDQHLTHRFHDLPPGRYAVGVFQDCNRNGRLDKNLFGAPTEPYGFSNNPRIRFRAPTFKEVAFGLSGHRTMKVALQ